ncbi:hypothetical protein [Nevskia sp.]|uniref:hypothetical protein n=1 Tax=Nevskia sp. TaxID=1929292 RepID=UPI0025E8EF56|nr:hypothetical protein [Nevskia sp.]
MRSPAIQLYFGDWRRNSNLMRCSWAARGAWIEIMAFMHDADRYGVLRWPLKEIAQAVGCPFSLVSELVSKGVLKGCDKGVCEPYVYTPRSGRRDGDPVTLIGAEEGPIWYSSRMVKDEHVRTKAGASTRFGAAQRHDDDDTGPPAKGASRSSPSRRHGESQGDERGDGKGVGQGDRQGDGSSSASASASAITAIPTTSGGKPPATADFFAIEERQPVVHGQPSGVSSTGSTPAVDLTKTVFDTGIALLTAAGKPAREARSLIGKLRAACGDAAAFEAISKAQRERAVDPAAMLMAACKPRPLSPHFGFADRDYREGLDEHGRIIQ